MSEYIEIFVALVTLAVIALLAVRMEAKSAEEYRELDKRVKEITENFRQKLEVVTTLLSHEKVTDPKGVTVEPTSKRFIVDLSEKPFLCLPSDLDSANFIRRNIAGHRWQTLIDRSTGKVHSCEAYYNQMQEIIRGPLRNNARGRTDA